MSLQWGACWDERGKTDQLVFVPAQARMLAEAIEGWLVNMTVCSCCGKTYGELDPDTGRCLVEARKNSDLMRVRWPRRKYVSLDLEDYQ